jgi:hypothetical protein
LQVFDTSISLLKTKYGFLVLLFFIIDLDSGRALVYLFPLLLSYHIGSNNDFPEYYCIKLSRIISILHFVFIIVLIAHFGESFDIRESRGLLGAGAPIVLVGFSLALNAKRKNILDIVLFLIYIYTTGSRTMLIGVSFVFFFHFGNKFRSVLLIVGLVLIYNLKVDLTELEFVYLPDDGFSEHLNFRGFEVFSVVNTFSNSSWICKFFGHGLSSRVPLFFDVVINNVEYNSVPIIHNSWFWLLHKFGLSGVIIMIIFLCKKFKVNKNKIGILFSFIISSNLVWGLLSFEWVVPMIFLFSKIK